MSIFVELCRKQQLALKLAIFYFLWYHICIPNKRSYLLVNNFLEKINEKKYELLLAKDYNILRVKYQLGCEMARVKKFCRDTYKIGKKYCRKLTLKENSPILEAFEKHENERQRRVRGDLIKFFSSDEQAKKMLNAYKNYIFRNSKLVKINESHKNNEIIIDGLRFDKNEELELVIVQKLALALAERKFNTRPDVQFVYERFLQDRKKKMSEREACTNGEKVNVNYYKNENQYIEGLLLKALTEYSKNKGSLIAKVERKKNEQVALSGKGETGDGKKVAVVNNDDIMNDKDFLRWKTAQELENEKLMSFLPNSIQEYWK